ncbi:MAG: DMT family transporter [Tepidisphaerales bacterium]
MAWLYLLLAGLCEVCWAAGLKRYGFNVLTWGMWLTAVFVALSFFFLSLAMRVLPVGVSYAVWVGVGAAGVAIYGVIMLGESTDWRKWLFLGFILAGVVGLGLTTRPEPDSAAAASKALPPERIARVTGE